MKSKCRVFNHPVHPMLVTVPIGLWVFSLVADILFLIGVGSEWRLVSAYSMAGGCLGALAAAVPGFIDYFSLIGPQARKIATYHMVINLVLVALYGFNFYYRFKHDYQVEDMPFMLSIISIIFLGVSGWLGGELVYVHKVAVLENK